MSGICRDVADGCNTIGLSRQKIGAVGVDLRIEEVEIIKRDGVLVADALAI